MTQQQIVQILIPLMQTVLWPLALILLPLLYHKLKAAVPMDKQIVLDGIVKHAVQMVEQTLAKATPEEKRKAAQNVIHIIASFFDIHDLDPEVVDTILESLVWETKQVKLDPVVTLDTTIPKTA